MMNTQSRTHAPQMALQRYLFGAETTEVVLIYVVMVAGGLWHIFEIFQTPMRLLAAPMVMTLTLWIVFRYDQRLRRFRDAGEHPTVTARFHIWSISVAVVSFAVEFAGVKTGAIFGRYMYTDVWIPSFRGVPIAIGFAWLGMLLASFGLAQRYKSWHSLPAAFQACVPAILMTVFDVFMEPAAVKLHYWEWRDTTGHEFFVAPMQNYLAWCGISYVLALLALRMRLFKQTMPRIAAHSYWAQLLYFAMVAWGKS
ncbi:MAG: carotenoid biosynthesis protein [Bacteroidota bacterium]|nr:carotenoid biosynthesis protein [Candidatus Kapabacteria bacterium]MDW8219764.1 carotenoid biosynthesis protein [Bacteroidota bacterium]